MLNRRRALGTLATLASIALLVAPAIWNGFPLLQYDTGGYLARWYEGTLVPSRAVAYGLILRLGVPLAFWPVLLGQAALTVWVVALLLRVHGLGRRPLLLLGMVGALSVVTTLPWLTAILLTDIFCGLGVLTLYLLLLRGDAVSRIERVGLIALTALSAATHSATIAVLAALWLAAAALWLIDRKRIPRAALGHGVIALVLGAVIVFAANYAVAKRLAWTPGGFALSFGRMLQDGIVTKYLDEHCPNATLKLCDFKDELPHEADTWFWSSPLFDSLGRFAGLGKEMERIAIDATVKYPGLQIKTAAIASARQMFALETGEGVVPSAWHTQSIVHDYAPHLVPAMRAARQQNAELPFTAINRVHVPVALAAMALLPLMAWFAFRRRDFDDIGELAATCMLALMANAVVCGVLANPHNRYGARMVWVAAFVILVALARLYAARKENPRLPR